VKVCVVGSRALLVMLRRAVHDHVEWPVELAEFRRLAEAAGFEIVGQVVQTRIAPHGGLLLGPGKVEELVARVEAEAIDAVVVYNVLSSMQKFKLQRTFRCEVLDRYEVVLRVFERGARDRVSQLQLELARLQKSYPFIKVGRREVMRRERSTRGTGAGPGEYSYHSELRQVRKRLANVKAELEGLRREKLRRLHARLELGIPLVCLVGCYSAGKTTLFNALTGAQMEVSGRPFTTLASKYARGTTAGMLFVDTIGFALGLDPELISAFQLNLDDMRHADVVLLLVDAVDAPVLLGMKLRSALRILESTGIENRRILVVLNKADLAGERLEKEAAPVVDQVGGLEWVAVSAATGENLDALVAKIARRYAEVGTVQPHEDGELD
jgi:GTP-binding protein HflX